MPSLDAVRTYLFIVFLVSILWAIVSLSLTATTIAMFSGAGIFLVALLDKG